MMERGGFEPPKAYAGRFTVCSLWPLGYPSVSLFLSSESICLRVLWSAPADRCAWAGGGIRTRDLLITNQLLYQLSYTGNSPPSGFRPPAKGWRLL